jgi:hypothetical protein
MWEGMDNVPRLLGSAVRERGKVDSLTSGMAEGGKGFGFGIWDGVTGLVTEPIHGAKQEVSARGLFKRCAKQKCVLYKYYKVLSLISKLSLRVSKALSRALDGVVR